MDIAAILVVTGVAFIAPLMAGKLRIPVVVLEILSGLILASFFQLSGTYWFDFLALMGLIFLMFVAGLEMDFSVLERTDLLAESAAYVAIGFLIAYLASVALGLHVIYAVFLTNVSLGLVVPVLKEEGTLETDFGRIVLLIAFVTDFATMILLSALIVASKHGSLAEVGLTLAVVALFAVFYVLGERLMWAFPGFFRRLYEDPMELGVRAAFALMILFSGVATMLGSEIILGAFLAGALFSAVLRGVGTLGKKLEAAGYGIFIPMFFIKAGADLNASLGEVDVGFVALLAVLSFVVKIAPCPVFFRIGKSNALRLGILQASKLSLTVAGAEIAMSAGILTAGEVANLVFFTLVAGTVAPMLYRMQKKWVDAT